MMNSYRTIVALSTLTIAGAAIASPIDLTIDPAQSSVDMSINIDVGIASDTDSDSSSLSGNIEIELDDDGNPTSIMLNDLMINIDDTMNFNWSFGFLGNANATLADGSVSYSTPGSPTGPVPIVDGGFTFPETFVNLGGLLSVNYDILLVGSGTEIVDLANQAPQGSEFSGSISIVGDTITVTATLPLDSVQPLTDADGNELGTATTTGTATIVAVGTIQTCPADLNGDGQLNFFDVSAFLNAFASMEPAADFNNDGTLNFFDVSAFLNAFTAGCP
jgi:hypothetical protein